MCILKIVEVGGCYSEILENFVYIERLWVDHGVRKDSFLPCWFIDLSWWNLILTRSPVIITMGKSDAKSNNCIMLKYIAIYTVGTHTQTHTRGNMVTISTSAPHHFLWTTHAHTYTHSLALSLQSTSAGV